jgi:hypothetical protein
MGNYGRVTGEEESEKNSEVRLLDFHMSLSFLDPDERMEKCLEIA